MNPSTLKNSSQADMIDQQIDVACEQACQMIAPAWPLDRAIAVNPHWQRIGMPLRQVAARMAVLGGIDVFPKREMQQKAWQTGRISQNDLIIALTRIPAAQSIGLTTAHCIEALNHNPQIARLPLLIDSLDQGQLNQSRLSWRQAITHQISQTCAAYFDEHQASWRPERAQGLYAFWKETLRHDHGISMVMGLPKLSHALDQLPPSRPEIEYWAVQQLGLDPSVWADYLEAVLLSVNGWASWCAYLGWQAKLEGIPKDSQDHHLRELLAIRLAWGAILLAYQDDASIQQTFLEVQKSWNNAPSLFKHAEEELLIDEVWQVALEIGYQRQLADQLSQKPLESLAAKDIEVQAAFCIDVRSEPMRRALETTSATIQTFGFAGFFGLPIAYTPLATQIDRPQLPGLLSASIQVTDQLSSSKPHSDAQKIALQKNAQQARTDRFNFATQWNTATRVPSVSFSFVEAMGLVYIGKLKKWINPTNNQRARDDLAGLSSLNRQLLRPQVTRLSLDDKVLLSANILHAMNLDRDLAPLVLLVGHASQSENNAHAASLDCGACSGQSGEVNTRTLAQLLNDPSVRGGLIHKGIHIPEQTWFIASLHNTTTDEIEGFDLDLLPDFALTRWNKLQNILNDAGDKVRRERAPKLGLVAPKSSTELVKKLRHRANDGAQNRPEWGLAGNAAFIIAPRAQSRGLDLGGRCFLHDYEASQDSDSSVLELLMTAPMIVTHWINWQYHASTSDPIHLGSGNKVLHNVVGGHIGVFEGNGGDLRIGLSRQSLNNGVDWVHETLRLTVVIEAPQQAIETIIQKHAMLQQLLNNGWLHLWHSQDSQLHRYELGAWKSLGLEVS
jgi:uncharacterized protein YbcC (UPF0753/DUF2309 family)